MSAGSLRRRVMSTIPKIGESEWYVMKALWDSAPLSGNDIVSAVSKKTDWSQSTILTMLRRLVGKKAVGIDKQKVNMYYPLIGETDVMRIQTSMFLNRVYQGSVNLLVKGFLENGDISEQDLELLKKMLDDMK